MKAVATVASAHVGAYSSDLPLLLELDDDEEEEEVDSLAPMVSLSLSLPPSSACVHAQGTTDRAHTPPTITLTWSIVLQYYIPFSTSDPEWLCYVDPADQNSVTQGPPSSSWFTSVHTYELGDPTAS